MARSVASVTVLQSRQSRTTYATPLNATVSLTLHACVFCGRCAAGAQLCRGGHGSQKLMKLIDYTFVERLPGSFAVRFYWGNNVRCTTNTEETAKQYENNTLH